MKEITIKDVMDALNSVYTDTEFTHKDVVILAEAVMPLIEGLQTDYKLLEALKEQLSASFKYTIGQEVTFYCSGNGAARGNVVEQMSYLNKENKIAVEYAIKGAGETYYHIPEKNVFPKSVNPGIVLKIMQYRSVSNEYLGIIAKEDLLKKKLDELLADIPEDIDIEV